MTDPFTRRVFRKISEGTELSHAESVHLAGCTACQRAAQRAAKFEAELMAALSVDRLEPLPADPRSTEVHASARPLRLAVSALVVMLALAAGIAGSRLLPHPPTAVAPSPSTTLAPLATCAEPTTAHGAPPAKPVADATSMNPIGPMDDGFAIGFTSFRSDGMRSWACLLHNSAGWRALALPTERPDVQTAITDGHAVALVVKDEGGMADSIVLARPTAVASADLRTANDAAWLEDWSFWGTLAPIPDGGFLLAQGTQLAIVKDNVLVFRPMPAGLTPLSATSEPATWLVASADSRIAGGRISGSWMLWHEGDAQPTPISGSWSRWLPATTGLLWLRGPDGWSLLQADGRLTALPPDRANAYDSEVSPDGSMELTGNGCPTDEPQGCHVRLVNLRTEAEIASFPGPGLVSWGADASVLFITQPHPTLGAPQIFLVAGGTVSQVQPPR